MEEQKSTVDYRKWHAENICKVTIFVTGMVAIAVVYDLFSMIAGKFFSIDLPVTLTSTKTLRIAYLTSVSLFVAKKELNRWKYRKADIVIPDHYYKHLP